LIMDDIVERRPKVGVGALIMRDNYPGGHRQILLAERKGAHGAGTYGSIGGHLEFGESPETGLKREAREELGIVLGNLEFICCANLVMYGQHYVDLGFKAEIISGEPRIQPAEVGKIESVGWYDLDNLPQPLFEPIKVYLEAVRSGQRFYDVRVVG